MGSAAFAAARRCRRDYGGVHGPDWYEGVGHRLEAQVGDQPLIAVVHSGAGGFAPVLAAAISNLVGLIFVDAVLPYPGRSVVETAPDWLVARLQGLTTDGRLAPWNTWFGDDPTPALIPDPAVRSAFVAELPRVPFAFLEAVAPSLAEWATLPCAYVRLSAAYDEAGRRGWRVVRADLHHLAMISHPEDVVALLTDLR